MGVILNGTQTTKYDPQVRQDDYLKAILSHNKAEMSGMFALLSMIKQAPTSSVKFEWAVDQLPAFETTFTASALSTESTFSVADASIFVQTDTWMNRETNDTFWIASSNVTGSDGSGTITVRRHPSFEPNPVTAGQHLIRVANAVNENSGRINFLRKESKVYQGQLQIYRKDHEVTTRALVQKNKFSGLATADADVKREMLGAAQMALHGAILGEELDAFEYGGYGVTRMMGLYPSIYRQGGNVFDANGVLYTGILDDWLIQIQESWDNAAGNEFYVIASAQFMKAMTDILNDRAKVQVTSFTAMKNVNITASVLTYESTNGVTLHFMRDIMFSRKYPGQAIFVTKEQLKLMYLSGGNGSAVNGLPRLVGGTQDNSSTAQGYRVEWDMGLCYGDPQSHFIVKNVFSGKSGSAL